MVREAVKRDILQIAGKYCKRENSDDKKVDEEDAFVGATLDMYEWEYCAFISEVETQLGIHMTTQEENDLYSQNLKALINLLCEKIGA